MLPTPIEAGGDMPLLPFYYSQLNCRDIVPAMLISTAHVVQLYPGMQRLNNWKIPSPFASECLCLHNRFGSSRLQAEMAAYNCSNMR